MLAAPAGLPCALAAGAVDLSPPSLDAFQVVNGLGLNAMNIESRDICRKSDECLNCRSVG